MVVSQETEQDSLLLTRNLLQIAIYNISYIRGLFHEKYFSDKSVTALEMKTKKLMPMDAQSRRLIQWMEKGVYDALQKKYLKTLLFCICEKEEGPVIEEYSFSFGYPSDNTIELEMMMSCSGYKGGTTFSTNASEVTPDQMRSSAYNMIKTLVSLMRTLDPMPEERTILLKLYYSDTTPEDYEPPFLTCSAEREGVSINWKHLALALKVKNVVFGDAGPRLESELYHNDDFSDTKNGSRKISRGFEKMEYHAASILKARYDQNWDHVYADQNEQLKYIPGMFPFNTRAFFDADGCLYHPEDYNFEKEEYPGISPIYNSVTISLDGPKDLIAYRVKMAAGHMRLYHGFYGDVLDVSSLVGYPKLIYTTASKGTFYINFTCTEYDPAKDDVIRHWVRLVTDCRDGWCYGFVNKHGHFEFNHSLPTRYIMHKDCQMVDFQADYSEWGIAPGGHGCIKMGHMPMRRSCRILSEYNGQVPAEEEVRRSCGVLVNGSCEICKFHPALFWLCVAISEGEIWTLDDCDPLLSKTLRSWSKIGRANFEVFLRTLARPGDLTEPKLPSIPGILTNEDAFDTVSIVPHNKIPRSGDQSNVRTWSWTLMEAHGNALIGRPHEWSHKFIGPSPYIPEMERVRPRHRIIDGAVIGKLVLEEKRKKIGTTARMIKRYETKAASPHLQLARKALNALRRI